MSTRVPTSIGKYLILGELGRGTTSSVYRARDTFAARDVAIKLFNHATDDPSFGGQHRSAFLTEAALVGKMLYFSTVTATRSTTIRSTTPVLMLEIKAASLSAASDACQVQFNKSFMRILIERLSAANKKLTERVAEL